MDVYCTTDSGSVKMATIYLDMGARITSGSLIGYYMGFFPVRLEEYSPSLEGWSEEDKEIYSFVYEDYRDVVRQVKRKL